MLKKIFLVLAVVVLLIVGLSYLEQPRLDRNWSLDQTIPATVQIEGDTVTIKNVRNFTYRSTTDYTPGYYDTTVNLNDLISVDYIVEPFGDIGAAHTFLSFGFADGQQIAISVEIRKEVGETFSPWKGLLRQYELVYVIADERDVIGLRASHRKHDVFLYPATVSKEGSKKLFLSMLNRTNTLLSKPEFYHTIFSNCTTNITEHINELKPGSVGMDYRLILPENSDVLAKELGFIAPNMTIEEARQRYKINDLAQLAIGREDFSVFIRQGLAARALATSTTDLYQVTEVIDGDTIEVKDGSGEIRTVRYIGVDTPEFDYENNTSECLAKEATEHNRLLVLGKSVSLERDVSEVDKYGRWLRYVTVGGQDVGEQLLSEGYAKVMTIPPDTRKVENYKILEAKAKTEVMGLWSGICEG